MILRTLSRALRTAALVCLAALVCVPAVHAQVPLGWVQVSASHTMDAGIPIASATIAFAPVDSFGHAISFRVGTSGGGQVGPDPFTAQIVNGAYTILLPDTSLTYAVNPCYLVTITDNASGDILSGPGYKCVQPSGIGPAVSSGLAWCAPGSGAGATCNWDLYAPNIPTLPTQVPGLQGVPSIGIYVNGNFVGAITAATIQVNGHAVGKASMSALTVNGGIL